MNRRSFLGFLRVAPLAAIPTLAASGLAVAKGEQTVKTLEKIAMTKDGVVFSNCEFKVGGNVQLVGDHQSLSYCHFVGQYQGAVIEVRTPQWV